MVSRRRRGLDTGADVVENALDLVPLLAPPTPALA